MRRIQFACVIMVGLLGGVASAQENENSVLLRPPRVATRSTVPEISLADVAPTPEMWLYSQELRRYEDPRVAVRRKAEIRGQQRQQRIAARKAAGVSKQRPIAYDTPFHTYFSSWMHTGYVWTYPHYSFEIGSREPVLR
jgi:hypothetical protein